MLYIKDMFYFDEINGKKILKSDLLEGVTHFFTTRESVIYSKEPEMAELVEHNRELIKNFLKVDELVFPNQTHSANVAFTKVGKTEYPETDALILDNNSQAIFLNFADCTPIILYDKKQNIAAISHAGWRGTVQKIAPKTVETMNSNPNDILAVIGPAIYKCCYNVGDNVFNQLKETVDDFTGLYSQKNDLLFVDLKGINARQLREIGIDKIDVCPYCTSCDNDMFFSYRKQNATTSRHSAVIRL